MDGFSAIETDIKKAVIKGTISAANNFLSRVANAIGYHTLDFKTCHNPIDPRCTLCGVNSGRSYLIVPKFNAFPSSRDKRGGWQVYVKTRFNFIIGWHFG